VDIRFRKNEIWLKKSEASGLLLNASKTALQSQQFKMSDKEEGAIGPLLIGA